MVPDEQGPASEAESSMVGREGKDRQTRQGKDGRVEYGQASGVRHGAAVEVGVVRTSNSRHTWRGW